MLHVRRATKFDLLTIKAREPDSARNPDLAQEGFDTLGPEVFAFESSPRSGAGIRLFAVLGLWEWMPGVGLVWGAIDISATRREVAELTVVALKYAKDRGLRRFEATSRYDFDQGHNWLERLGFKAEGLMPCYGPDGGTHVRYALTFPENVK